MYHTEGGLLTSSFMRALVFKTTGISSTLPRKTSAALELVPEFEKMAPSALWAAQHDHPVAESYPAMLQRHSLDAVGYCSKDAQALEGLGMQCLD